MPRIEKTVFISYRRTNFWTALAIFQNLYANGYDVFFDYKSIPSGDFEQAIIENIKSRSHFIVILSPSALERCHEQGDWLRREVETAIDNKRNIIPLVMEGFDFGSPATVKALTGKLAGLKKYNALGIPVEYFDDAMIKLRSERFLNKPLESVSHPVSGVTRQFTEEQKSAAKKAVLVETEQLTAQEWFERGYVFQQDKNFSEALRCYNEVIRIQPDLPEAFLNRSAVRFDQDDLDGAIEDSTKAIELRDPELHLPYNNRGNARWAKGELDLALQDLNEAIRLKPDYAEAYSNRGLVRDGKGDLDGALQDYDQALRLKIDFAEAYNNRGLTHYHKDDLDEALQDFTEALRLKPDYIDAYLSRGVAFRAKGDLDRAIADYENIIRLKPNHAQAYSNRGIALRAKGKLIEAIQDYDDAIRLKPNFFNAFFNRGLIYVDIGDLDAAIQDFNEAVRLKPNDAEAYYYLGITLKELKLYAEAEVAYRKAIEIDPSDIDFYNKLTILLRATNKEKDAIPVFEKIIEINPEDFNSYLGITSINKTLGGSIESPFVEKARYFIQEDDFYNKACLESVCDNFDLALEYLQKAAQKEKFNPKWAWEDPDLQWIRNDTRFVEIVGRKPEE